MASASRRRRTHPSCPRYEAYIKAVSPPCGKCSTRGVIECQSTRGAWASTRGCGARHATRTRVPSSAGRRGGGAASAAARAVQRAVVTGAVSGERGGESSRGGEDAGAHARHMRRRTTSRQLTFPPRPISRVSSASLPFLAASNTASPIESLIASAALYRPSPARSPAHSGGHARLRCDARQAAAHSVAVRMCSSPTRPSELGWPRQPWREGASRTLAATTARSRGCRNAWLPRPRAAWCGRAKQAIGLDEGIGRASRKRSPQKRRAASQ